MQPPIYKPPYDPRFKAAIAAGVMVLISGIFAFIMVDILLTMELWHYEWDSETWDEVRVMDTAVLIVGVTFAVAGIVAFISTYFTFRTEHHIYTIAGPAALLTAYFSLIFYEPVAMIAMAHILVTAIISLWLLYYARSLFKVEGKVVPKGPSIAVSEQKG